MQILLAFDHKECRTYFTHCSQYKWLTNKCMETFIDSFYMITHYLKIRWYSFFHLLTNLHVLSKLIIKKQIKNWHWIKFLFCQNDFLSIVVSSKNENKMHYWRRSFPLLFMRIDMIIQFSLMKIWCTCQKNLLFPI